MFCVTTKIKTRQTVACINCSLSFPQLLNFVKLCQMTWWNVMLTSISKWQISWNKRISFVNCWKQTAYTEIVFEAQEKATKGLQNLDTKTSEPRRKIKFFIATFKWQIFRIQQSEWERKKLPMTQNSCIIGVNEYRAHWINHSKWCLRYVKD